MNPGKQLHAALNTIDAGLKAIDQIELGSDAAAVKYHRDTITREHVNVMRKIASKRNVDTPSSTYKLKVGFVAAGNEVKLVKQVGVKYARVQSWPGGAKEILDSGAFNQGIEVSIRIAREYIPTGTSKALEPLTTDATRHAMIGKITADLKVYQPWVKSIILGNEPDGKRNGQPRYWTGAIDRFGSDWARHIAPLVRSIRVGFGLPIFATNTKAFLLDLVNSGAYQPGDFLAVNIYGGSATDHHQRLDDHIAAIREAIPAFDLKNLEVSEAGLQRPGPADAWLAEFETTIDIYRSKKFPGAVSFYRIDENDEAPFAPFKDGKPTATFDKWKAIAA